jgi:hypothetical protein
VLRYHSKNMLRSSPLRVLDIFALQHSQLNIVLQSSVLLIHHTLSNSLFNLFLTVTPLENFQRNLCSKVLIMIWSSLILTQEKSVTIKYMTSFILQAICTETINDMPENSTPTR